MIGVVTAAKAQEAHLWHNKAMATRAATGSKVWPVRRGPFWNRYWTLLIERPTTIPKVVR